MTAPGWIWVAVAVVAAVLDWIAVANESPVLERCAKPAVLVALLAAAGTARPGHPGVHGWLILALCCGLLGDIALSFAPAGSIPAGRPAPGGQTREPAGQVLPQPVAAGSTRPTPDSVAQNTELPAEQVASLPAEQVASRPAAEVASEPAGNQPPHGLFVAGLASFLLGHLCYCVAMLHYGVDRLSVGFGLVLVLLALYAFGHRVLTGAHQQGGNKLMIPVAVYVAALGSVVMLGVGTTSLWLACGTVEFAFSDLVLATDRFVVRRSWAPLTVAISYHLAQLHLLIGLVR